MNISSPAVRAAGILTPTRVSGVGIFLIILAFWMLRHPYEGLVHDSVLYAFAALARLHPASLGRDIYLSVGVQDRHTLFSPLAAAIIRIAGLDRATALITFAAQMAFFSSAWLVARRLMSPAEALLSTALLVVLPPTYGDGHIFSYAESFMTARLPSEVLVLGALAAALGDRPLLGVVCLAAAALLHPIIAAAGVALWLMLSAGLARPRLALAFAAGAFVAVVAAAWLVPIGPVARFDMGWFDLLYNRGTYLFPSRWAVVDWAHGSVPLATLAVGAITNSQPRIRSVCLAALATGLSGLAISLLGSDLLRVILIAQVQPWRWLWLSNALAVILIPTIFKDCWNTEDSRRAGAVLLAAAWVCIDEPYVLAIVLLAIAAVSSARHITDPRHTRLILIGAWTLLGLSLLILAGFVFRVNRQLALIPPDTGLYDSPYLLALRHWKSWQAGGILPASIVLCAWWAMRRHSSSSPIAFAVLTLGLALSGAFMHLAWNAWTRVNLPAQLYAEFEPWRAVIPEHSQVLWGDDAFPIWFLLERPSYWSRSQTSASVYSEAMARELARRQWVIFAVRDSTHDPRQRMVRTCRANPALDYYISAADAGPTPYPAIRDPKGSDRIRLYRCADYRG